VWRSLFLSGSHLKRPNQAPRMPLSQCCGKSSGNSEIPKSMSLTVKSSVSRLFYGSIDDYFSGFCRLAVNIRCSGDEGLRRLFVRDFGFAQPCVLVQPESISASNVGLATPRIGTLSGSPFKIDKRRNSQRSVIASARCRARNS
jgi:hypothetical protein